MRAIHVFFLVALVIFGFLLSENNHLASRTEALDVKAARRGNPWVKLSDGVELATVYAGEPAPQQLIESNRAEPCSMASDDFDEDGSPDLAVGYSTSDGGLLVLHRGNPDAVYPNSPEAQQRREQGRFSDSPFLSPASVIEIPEPVRFLGAGDFDADGHSDLVTAARGSDKLYFKSGDGRGNLNSVKVIPLPGLITALATGEINRGDGLADVVVALKREDAFEVLVFESPEGASRAKPEAHALSGEVKAISLAQLDDDYLTDLALGAGSEFIVIHGRDRKLSPATISKVTLPFPLNSIATGDFKGDHRLIAAALSEDGKITLISQESSNDKKRGWRSELLDTDSWPQATGLMRARVSSIPGDDLIVIDAPSSKLHIITADPAAADRSNVASHIRDSHIKGRATAALEVEGGPVAALTMRLNADALSDLVILRKNQSNVSVVMTDAASPLVVPEQEIYTGNSDPNGNITSYRASNGSQAWRITSTHRIGNTTYLPQMEAAFGDFFYVSYTTPTSFFERRRSSDGQRLWLIEASHTVGATTYLLTSVSIYNGEFLYVTYGGRFLARLRASDGQRTWLVSADIPIGQIIYHVTSVSAFNGFIYTTNSDPNGSITKYREADGGQVWRINSTHTVGAITNLPTLISASSDSLYVTYGNRYLAQLRASDGQRNWLVDAGVTQGATTFLLSSGVTSGDSVYTTNSDSQGLITKYNACSGGQVYRLSSTHVVGATTNFPRLLSASGVFLYVKYGPRYLSQVTASNLNKNWVVDGAITIAPTTYFVTTTAVDEMKPLTFTVINTNNSGCGSLRQAIIDANANPGADTISFQIGTGARTIQLTSALPAITDPVTIDATTQPGFSGTPLITLDGSGITTSPADGLAIVGGSSVVRGLVINRFTGNGVSLSTNGGNIIEGNYIGVNQSGTAATTNSGQGVSVGSPNNLIGGTAPSARNVISGNNQSGVAIEGGAATGNTVQGNYVGTNQSGTLAVPNSSHGVIASSDNNVIGGTSSSARNVISGNGASGVALSGSANNQVQRNFIGTDVTGAAPLMNSLNGVLINAANNNLIGGTAAGAGNIIAFNGGAGTRITSGAGNAVRSNSIFSNTGIGIDLGPSGVTPNDALDADIGPNDLQNFPVLTSASSSGGSTTILGTINSTAAASFAVEFFSNSSCDDSGNGEAQTFIGSATVMTNNCGNATIDLTFPVAVPVGQFITATAIDSNNNASEFSECVQLGAAACAYVTCPTSQFFTTAGGSGSVSVTAPSGCNWEAATNDNWITIKAGNSSGDGSVAFFVSENLTGSSRQGALMIANLSLTVVQDGGAGDNCAYSISPTFRSFSASGGSGSMNVATVDRCAWQATSNVNWLTITSGNVSVGNGAVTYTVTANLSATGRQGTITVGGRIFTVKQKGG